MITVSFDAKENDPIRIHNQALRFAKSVKDMKWDIEVAGLLHLFVRACGVTQEEMESIWRESN